MRHAREALARDGRARLPKCLTEDAAAGLARELVGLENWRRIAGDSRNLEIAEVNVSIAAPVFEGLGLGAPALVSAARHSVGDLGLPPMQQGRMAFCLDLNAGWSSEHGGLLLFVDNGRVEGWRPEPGALTLFDPGSPPLLSAVAPAAPAPRLALFGTLT